LHDVRRGPVNVAVITLGSTSLKLPTKIRLTEGDAYLDGGTIHLKALTESNRRFSIHLNQHMFPGTSKPGRLLCNGKLVDIRSERESYLLCLLENAEIQIEELPRPDADPNYIGPPIESIESEQQSRIDWLDELRNSIIDFVRSERYIEVSKHGV
jgi:hypothetical protein